MRKKINDFFFDEDSYWSVSDKICMVLLAGTVCFAAYTMFVGWGVL